MFNNKLISVLLVILILIGFACCTNHVYAQKLHLITMHDSVTGISDGCKTDVESIQRLLSEWKNKSLTSMTTHERAQGLIQKINALPVGGNDILFFFYAGHGECDRNNEHYLTISYSSGSSDRLPRKQLREALLSKNAKLTIIITDCCAAHADVDVPQGLRAPCTIPNLQRLFSFSGVADINSSSPGEYAWSVTEYFQDESTPITEMGSHGLFTEAFFNTLALSEISDWQNLAVDLKKNVISDFNSFKLKQRDALNKYSRSDLRRKSAEANWQYLRNQKAQTPWFFSLPKAHASSGNSAGGNASTRQYGVRVVLIQANTTASSLTDSRGNAATLNLNDIIYSINGTTLRNQTSDYNKAIDSIGQNGRIALGIIDAQTGQKKTLHGKLDYSTRARFGVGIRDD